MKPRIFVSSTYYDLKHVRERLEHFIDNYGFESVLFESDKVTYEFDKPIDISAYNEVKLYHVMILIVGGRYGSSATNGSLKDDIKKYEQDYISVTRKEFETALEKNIPLFIFIEKNVLSEYRTFKENQDFFENMKDYENKNDKKSAEFKFAHVDSVNVFKFIDLLITKPIKSFEKIEQIENYLQSQFAGLFYLYLDGLQKQKEVLKVLNSVEELNNVTLRMNTMLTSVGEKILGKDNQEYEEVIEEQFTIISDFFCEQLYDFLIAKITVNSDIDVGFELTESQINLITNFMYENILIEEIDFQNFKSRNERALFIKKFNLEKISMFNLFLENNEIPFTLEYCNLVTLNNMFYQKVKPYIQSEKSIEIFKDNLNNQIDFLFTN